MWVKVLAAMHYPPGDSPWHWVQTPNPDWPAIEAAIRRLDRNEWPFVWLHKDEPLEDEPPLGGLCIMGGRGEYNLFSWRGDTPALYYTDTSRSGKWVRIWESDQGSEEGERFLCSDIGRVLAMICFFIDRGEMDPSAVWVER